MTRLRKPQNRTALTRARLLDTARTLVAQHGFAALKVDALVAAAGTAKGTFFAHFPDREHLIATLVAERLMSDLAALTKVPQSPVDLVSSLRATINFLATDLQILGAVVRFSGPDEGAGTGLYAALVHLANWLTDAISQMQKLGAIRQDRPPMLLAEAVQAVVLQSAVNAACDVGQNAASLEDLLDLVLAPCQTGASTAYKPLV